MTTPPTGWQALSHQQLYDLVNQGPGREASRAHEEVWTQVQQAIDDGHTNLRAALGRAADEWIGAAAKAMQGAAQPFASWCATAVDDAGGIAAALAAQGEHAARLRQLMPGPSSFTSTVIDVGEKVVTASSPGLSALPEQVNPIHQAADDMRNSTAEAEDARRLMASYADDSVQRANGLGFWSTPPTMVVTHGPPDAPSGGAPGGQPHAAGPAGSPAPALPPSQAAGPGGTPGPVLPGAPPATGPRPPDPTTPATPVAPAQPGPPRAGSQTPVQVPVPAPMPSARSAPRPSSVPPPRGTGIDLPPGQGGRGVKPAPFPEPQRPTGPPSRNPTNWRELVAGESRTTRPPAVAEPPVRGRPAGEPILGGSARAAEGRAGSMYPPMAGAGAGGGGDRTKGRPAYLQDESGFFADDRWVSEAVIGQDDVLPED
ncbi:hypothetical protein ACQEVB_06400 [Pseudonocardia sp. CA-107938]|uniref:hypothetical protein n=1 Tax=Pseudonocardia sp. CA-107938 TaxID=3240021 RepID=UPI003D90368C